MIAGSGGGDGSDSGPARCAPLYGGPRVSPTQMASAPTGSTYENGPELVLSVQGEGRGCSSKKKKKKEDLRRILYSQPNVPFKSRFAIPAVAFSLISQKETQPSITKRTPKWRGSCNVSLCSFCFSARLQHIRIHASRCSVGHTDACAWHGARISWQRV